VRSAAFENTAIRSSSLFACILTRASPPDSYIIMPDMLKNAPMFKKAAVASKMARSSSACGRRSVRLTVSCHSQGRGGGGRGRGGGGRGGGRVSASQCCLPLFVPNSYHHRGGDGQRHNSGRRRREAGLMGHRLFGWLLLVQTLFRRRSAGLTGSGWWGRERPGFLPGRASFVECAHPVWRYVWLGGAAYRSRCGVNTCLAESSSKNVAFMRCCLYYLTPSRPSSTSLLVANCFLACTCCCCCPCEATCVVAREY
jgi:hypothetical protein